MSDILQPGDAHGDVLRLDRVTKSFPGVRALRDASFTVASGEVHALLGENGAGKSTLMKIACGALAPDAGTVHIGGVALGRHTPQAARALGLRVLHQERQIAAHLSVAENVLLDRVPTGPLGLVGRRRTERAARALLDELGIGLDPGRSAADLNAAEAQLVALARALSAGATVLVLDEPTASLQGDEVRVLFDIVRTLAGRGVGIVFISHHLDEVYAIADRVTVMRDGAVVGTVPAAGTRPDQLTAMIFGQSVDVSRAAVRADLPVVVRGEPLVEVENIHLGRTVNGVSLTVHAGEVVALTGPLGSGASEVAQLVAGARGPSAGRITHATGAARTRPPRTRRDHARCGVAFLPADRKHAGVLLEHSVTENVALGDRATSRRVLLRRREDRRRAAEQVHRLGIRVADVRQRVQTLSGGNQQKVVLGRWLAVRSRVLVLDEPTAGVDVAAKVEIYRLLLAAAADGAAVLIVSSDFEEIHALADRVLVVCDGRVVAELPGHEADPHRVMQIEMEGRSA
ncbi:sugar ABC transporter ATP-binding protein [Pseudonocardia benzenivorans]|uniref:Sugar ABC transporter ATP-binding protein n=1 Tax=Pseudonocardia benzenivorans TaxID=228005 RepID=A0ABW3VM68_9PSEU